MDEQVELHRDQGLLRLLQHLEIPRAHFATRQAENVAGLVGQWPEVVASLTFICPGALDAESLAKHADRVLCVRGDRGPGTELVGRALAFLPAATEHVLEGYSN